MLRHVFIVMILFVTFYKLGDGLGGKMLLCQFSEHIANKSVESDTILLISMS